MLRSASSAASSCCGSNSALATARGVVPQRAAFSPAPRNASLSTTKNNNNRMLRRKKRSSLTCDAISIDRRAHMELAWKRQQEEEAALAALASLAAENKASFGTESNKSKSKSKGNSSGGGNTAYADADDTNAFAARRRLLSCPPGTVSDLRNVAHLDALAAAAAPAVLAVAFYSRSCGICKETLAAWSDAAVEFGASASGVIFLKHDCRDAFDEATDLCRLYRVRAVPSLLFFAGGAAVSRVTLADARVVAPLPGGKDGVDRRRRMRVALQELIFRETPSARR